VIVNSTTTPPPHLSDQVIALAAIFQFVALVEQLAKSGQVDTKNMELAVSSLYCQNPLDTLEVYGGRVGNLSTGLQLVFDVLGRTNRQQRGADIVRYVIGILYLQKRLIKHASMLDVIASRLKKSQQQAEHFSLTHDNVIGGLADIYSDTISTFSFRIQVMGDYQHLQQPRIANQIRTLLFAAVRSAVLWRQLGGSRLKVFLKRRQLHNTAAYWLKSAKQDQLDG
jgi:high frequency lysogenization protein